MVKGSTLEKTDIQRIFSGFAIQAQKQLHEILPERRRRVLVLAGPTACGKTQFAIDLAAICDGEIVSADSMQVYRGMDIGTAKASPEQQLLIHHHLIDIRDVTDPFSVVDFYYEARHRCQLINAQNHAPIVVGGSGFYIHSLIYGPPAGPPSVPDLRDDLNQELEKKGPDAMYEKLRKLDLQYANTITRNDKQKIIRGLEIIMLTGKPVSELTWKTRSKMQNFDFRCWFLYRPREVLYDIIENRCRQILDLGFLDEVRKLKQQGLELNSSACQAIGYRQALTYLDSSQTEEDYKKFVEDFMRASRNYAKRQFTWFRKEPLFRWVDLDMHDPEVIMDMILTDYEAR